jgi:Cof subfamily protein (haloacid dehalogenase superfamily)
MNFIKYKLIISDLDGTLVKCGSNSVSEAVINSIFLLKEKDIFFTIGTGRSWKQTKDIAKKLMISIPVIVQAGAIIVDPVTEKTIRQQPLREELAVQLSGILNSTEVDQFCLNENGSYFANQVNTSGGNWLLKCGEDCRLTNNEGYSGERALTSIIKFLFIGPEPLLRLVSEKIRNEILPQPNMIMWPPAANEVDWFLEVFDPMASKGQALRWLAKYLKIKLNQIIAFGDGSNDIDMLQRAGLGVAMENAPQPVTTHARIIIPGPEQDGIARFLSNFCYKGVV